MIQLGRAAALSVALVAVSANGATAQEAAGLSIGFGAGIAAPLRADFGFTAATWEGSVRFGVRPRLMIEGAFSAWDHTKSSAYSNITLQGPAGPIGFIAHATTETHRIGRVAQMNVLGRFTVGRLELFGGGGGGVLTLSRRYSQTSSGCVSSIAAACQDSGSDFTASSFTGQAVGGGDVHLTRRLSVFAQMRFSVPLADVGSSDLRTVAGVRVVLR